MTSSGVHVDEFKRFRLGDEIIASFQDCPAGFIRIPALDDKRFSGQLPIIRPLCGLSVISPFDGVIVPPEKDDVMALRRGIQGPRPRPCAGVIAAVGVEREHGT